MALSYITYNGGQDSYQIPFPYIDKSHIQVTLNGEITEYTWESDTTVSLLQPNDSSDWVSIKRITPRDHRLVDFKDGSLLTEENLDTSAEQLLYILQEAYDNMVEALGFDEEAGAYDAQGFRIMNVGQAESDRDVFTIENFKNNYLPDIRDDFVPEITQFAETAEQARDTAVSAKEDAVTAEASAESHAATAVDAKNYAEVARNQSLMYLQGMDNLEHKGEWDLANTPYDINNIVTLNGSSYMLWSGDGTTPPPDENFWRLIAHRGDSVSYTVIDGGWPDTTHIDELDGGIL